MNDLHDASPTHENPNPMPESFVDQVKEALENLYDFPTLQRHELTRILPSDNGESAAHRLRRELINAIETLNPGHDTAVRSGAARIYNLMHLHYVGGMTLQESAFELGISLRQVYRDLRRGQESVSVILWYLAQKLSNTQRTKVDASASSAASSAASPDASPDAEKSLTNDESPTKISSIQSEMARLEGSIATVQIEKILHTALRAVQRLAENQGIRIEQDIPEQPVTTATNLAIAQQVLTHLLSQTIQQVKPSHLRVKLESQPDSVLLTLAYSGKSTQSPNSVPKIEPVITELMRQIRWKIQHRFIDDETQVVIRVTQGGAKILVVDDNEGLVNLLERFFTGLTYQVLSANNGEDGLRLAQEALPDVIIMDLMMPGMDGWELLQRLRTYEETASIPVIICSVINDPELAFSLGAARFVSKPVNKDMLLNALKELKI